MGIIDCAGTGEIRAGFHIFNLKLLLEGWNILCYYVGSKESVPFFIYALTTMFECIMIMIQTNVRTFLVFLKTIIQMNMGERYG